MHVPFKPTKDELLIEKQWEKIMADSGIERYQRACDKAKKQGSESNTSYGVSMLKEFIDDTREELERDIERFVNKPGTKPKAYEYLSQLDLKVCSYLTCKSIIDGLSKTVNFASLALNIGQKIEDNVRMELMEAGTSNRVMEIINGWAIANRALQYRKKKAIFLYNESLRTQSGELPEFQVWPAKDKLHIGTACIDAFQRTGMIDVYIKKVSQNKTVQAIKGSQLALEWIKANKEFMQHVAPDFMPTLIPPRAWSTPFDGGYYLEAVRKRARLIKTRHGHKIQSYDMPEVYRAVNSLQNTAWTINPFVLDVFKDQLTLKHGVGLPGTEKLVPPPCPLKPFPEQGELTHKEYKDLLKACKDDLTQYERDQYAEWKRTCLDIELLEETRVSRMLQITRTYQMGAKLAKVDQFYFVYDMDFRGRLYALGTGINPQGNDISKGLLLFKEALPLGKHGYKHFQYYVAGLFGIDKVSLADRLAWYEDNKENILRVGTDPLNTTEWWKQADKPYCFLAACEEAALIIQLYKGREHEFLSRVPVSIDGSCNGIQHYSAMLRDKTGAIAVNLMNSTVPEDIYQLTANHVINNLKKAIDQDLYYNGKEWVPSDEEQAELAYLWLNEYGIDRTITKKPTMIIPYGGVKITCQDAISDMMKKKNEKQTELNPMYITPFQNIPGNGELKAARYLNHLVWLALDEVVVAARTAMDFLRKIMRGIQKNVKGGQAIVWKTDLGFPIYLRMPDIRKHRIYTRLSGSVIELTIHEDLKSVSKYKMASCISPNFIHGLDATHLMKTVNLCSDFGITSFMPIHDSYGTHAGNIEVLHQCTRHTFVELHKVPVLEKFWVAMARQFPEQVQYMPLLSDIQNGDFDLNNVLSSTFFFR